MKRIGVSGWGVVSAAGIGKLALTQRTPPNAAGASGSLEPAGEYPPRELRAIPDFDVRKLLGRKGTSQLDRRSAITMVTSAEALEHSHHVIDDSTRARIGISLGTTCGSFKSMSDYTRQTFEERKPYLVDPGQFPNTVLNCAAGQTAIRFGLKGVNATVAGGPLAFLNAVSYTANQLDRGYADAVLTGSVEELTPHTAWSIHLCAGDDPTILPGEGAGMFMLESLDRLNRHGRRCYAEILSVTTRFCPGSEVGKMPAALAACVARCLLDANLEQRDIACVIVSEEKSFDRGEGVEFRGLEQVLGAHRYERIGVKQRFGECQAANGALQFAALLCADHSGRDDKPLGLLTATDRDGYVGAAVVRVCP